MSNNSQISIVGKKYELVRTSEKVFNSPLVSKIESSTLLELLMQFITKLHNDCGQKVNAEDLVIQSNELLNSLLKNYKWITISEIPNILSLGRRKNFGEYYGLNLNTYEVWIDAYYAQKRADEIKSKRLNFAEKKQEKPTAEQNEKAFNNLLKELILEYQSTNEISSTYLYRLLYERGELPLHTREYKTKIKKRAIKKLYKKKGSSADLLTINKRNSIIKLALNNGLDELETIELLKKHKLRDLPTVKNEFKKTLKKVQGGGEGLNDVIKEIILIDYINKKLHKP